MSVWQRLSYSSAEPSHQWTDSGWVSSATSSTHSISFWCLVSAVSVAVLSLTDRNHSLIRLGNEIGITPYRGAAFFRNAPTEGADAEKPCSEATSGQALLPVGL